MSYLVYFSCEITASPASCFDLHKRSLPSTTTYLRKLHFKRFTQNFDHGDGLELEPLPTLGHPFPQPQHHYRPRSYYECHHRRSKSCHHIFSTRTMVPVRVKPIGFWRFSHANAGPKCYSVIQLHRHCDILSISAVALCRQHSYITRFWP